MRQFIRRDKGNALILGALSFAVLAAFGVLTIDVGRMLVTKNQLQNAADAGALAGASMYCSSAQPTEAAVRDRVRLVGQAHKSLAMGAQAFVTIPDAQIAITQPAGTSSHTVTVNTQSTTQQFFVNLMNAEKWFTAGKAPGNTRGQNITAVAAAACGATCGVNCVKPWSPPDRWDDVTGIPGYMGEGSGKNKRPDWRNNKHWDSEKLTLDLNGNGLYDPGDSYVDGNNNGKYDAEAYNPSLTGYIPDPIPGNSLAPNGDLGMRITLDYNNGNAPVPGQYQPIDLPPLNRGTPVTGANEFNNNIKNCNTSEVWPGDVLQLEPGAMVGPTNAGMRDLIAQDPNAYWDPTTLSVQGSAFAVSPRIVLIPLYDPRIPVASGRNTVIVTKVAAFFMEQMTGNGQVEGRFLKVREPGQQCIAGAVSFTYSMNLIK